MKFIHVTDLHLVPEGELLWGLSPVETLDACLADIARHHADAAFVAVTGDLAERGEVAAYQLLKDRLAGLALPAVLLLGNHDDRANFRSVFSDTPLDRGGFVQQARAAHGGVFLFLDRVRTLWYTQRNALIGWSLGVLAALFLIDRFVLRGLGWGWASGVLVLLWFGTAVERRWGPRR